MGGREASYFYDFSRWELYRVLIVKIREESPSTSGRGRGKETILKYATAFCS